MNDIKTIPHTVVAVCTECQCMLWVDGAAVPTATGFVLKCEAEKRPMFQLEAGISRYFRFDGLKLDSASAQAVLACVSTDELEKALTARRKEIK